MKTNILFIGISVAVIVFILLFFAGLNLFVDWLFFIETGYVRIFAKVLSTKIVMAFFCFFAFLVFAGANVALALRPDFRQKNYFVVDDVIHQMKRGGLEKIIKPAGIIAVLVLAVMVGKWGSILWEEFLLFKNSIATGVSDPIMGKDIGFYFFRLPFLNTVKNFIGLTLVVTAVMVTAGYFLRGGLFVSEKTVSVDERVKKHIGVLAGLFILNIAFGFYLDTYRLLFSDHGVIYGAGYTDIHARLFFYRILVVLTVAAGILFTAGIVKRAAKTALVAPAIVLAVYVLGIAVYPAVLQKFKVAPNELSLETPYIEHNIAFSRLGYDLDRIEVIPFDVDYDLTSTDIVENAATIKNVRLWDHGPILKTYSQLQQIRTYYKFLDVDNDRYEINGEYMQVMLSPRELSYDDLPSRTWINERLIFTHGYGIALGPVSRITREGLPEFVIKDIPPAGLSGMTIERPEIYYGELPNDYVITNTGVSEFDYPTSDENVYTVYKGSGGVTLDSFFKKLLYAAKFGAEKIILSSDITEESRILYYRDIMQRVRKIAPFLVLDRDPYLVISREGRLFWTLDAYTVSARMPYSRPVVRGINYIRNSVKVLVDAYNGTVEFYVSDPEDIVIRVYSRIFPGVFRDIKDMPADLRRHIRYPQWLLQIQAHMFASYHMKDVQVFYNKENLWEVPVFGEGAMEPYYTIMKLPGEKKEEYILLLPYTPAKRDNLAAWLAARCDEPHYGRLVVYTFPRDRLIYGPKQVDARINQDAQISQQLTLWDQRGSQVIRGSLLVIPIERSLLYVQPLYLSAADRVGLPELRRVIVAYGNDVVMEETFDLALQKLFGTKEDIVKRTADTEERREPPAHEISREALVTFRKALEMQRQGDWAGYGREIKRLEEILKRMAK